MLLALCEFNTRKGNQIAWLSEQIPVSKLPFLEFKMIPSGMHERQSDAVFFECGEYHGICRYECRVKTPGSREGVQMYAFGVLTLKSEPLLWKYEPVLKLRLHKFLDTDSDFSVLNLDLNSIGDPKSNPVNSLCAFTLTYGAQIFEIWKAGLCRKRLIFEPAPTRGVRSMCHFAYLASKLSEIPQEVHHLLPKRADSLHCMYNVTINDLESLQQNLSFSCCTTDSLLLVPGKRACDFIVKPQCLVDMNSVVIGEEIRATYRDEYQYEDLCAQIGVGISKRHIWGSLVNYISELMATSADDSLLEPEHLQIEDIESQILHYFDLLTCKVVRILFRAASEADEYIRISKSDIAAMGLDPFSQTDFMFLNSFAKFWFTKPVAMHASCCF